MLAAPLIAGNDVRSMSEQTRAVLTNSEVIAVDQDRLVAQAAPLPQDSRILVKPLAEGAVAVALFNPGDQPAVITTSAPAVGLRRASCYAVRDLWTHIDATSSGAVGDPAVPAHGLTMLRISVGCG